MLTPHPLSIHPPRHPFREKERHVTAELELQSLSCLAQLLLQFLAREPTCVQRPDIFLCPPCPKFYNCPLVVGNVRDWKAERASFCSLILGITLGPGLNHAHQQTLISDKGRGFPGGAVVRNPPANAGDTGSSAGPGRSHMPRSN